MLKLQSNTVNKQFCEGTTVTEHYFICSFTLKLYLGHIPQPFPDTPVCYPTCSLFLVFFFLFPSLFFTMFERYMLCIGGKSVSKHFKFLFLILSQLSLLSFPNLVALHHNPELKDIRYPADKRAEYFKRGFDTKLCARIMSPQLPHHILSLKS